MAWGRGTVIVWVNDALFADDTRDVDRVALLRGAARRRHTLFVSSDARAARAERRHPAFEVWRAGLPERRRAEVDALGERLAMVSATTSTLGAERLLVSRTDPRLRGLWLTIDEAVRAVELPTFVLVENVINDRAFLLRAMPPRWRTLLASWEQRGLLRFEHGGGNDSLRVIVERFTDDGHAFAAFGLPSRVWCRVHVAIYDHDGDRSDAPSMSARRLHACCEGRMAHHRLLRRDQEHYLPAQALKRIIDERVTDAADAARLAADVDAHVSKGDARHFVPLPKLGKDPFFKGEFASSATWPDAWFRDDGAWPEMTSIAEKIAAAL